MKKFFSFFSRYDLAEFPNVTEHISPWCALFSEDNLKMLDFNDDLVFYQIGGYGHDINWKMTKPLVVELENRLLQMKYLDKTYFEDFKTVDDDIFIRNGTNDKKAYLYFSHSETVNTMLPVLGLYNDSKPLEAADWPSSDHLWQTSKMLGFSHNIALVGLQCEDREEEWNIMVMHQEKPIMMPACADYICPFSTFMERLQPVLDVDFEFECNHDVLYPDSRVNHHQ